MRGGLTAEEYRWKLIQRLIPKATASRVELDHDPDAETIQEHLGLVVTEDYSEHHACKEGGEKDCGRSYPPVVRIACRHVLRGVGMAHLSKNLLTRPELQEPPPDRLVGCVNPSLRQQFLDIPKGQREPGIEPDRVADDFWWEAVALKRYWSHPMMLIGD